MAIYMSRFPAWTNIPVPVIERLNGTFRKLLLSVSDDLIHTPLIDCDHQASQS
jgi:hypothetical protein